MSGLQQSPFAPLSVSNYAVFSIAAVLAHSLQKSLRKARLSALGLVEVREGQFSRWEREHGWPIGGNRQGRAGCRH
jgi:hypothetical protein